MACKERLSTSTLVLTASVTAEGVADCADLLSGGGTDSVFAILAS